MTAKEIVEAALAALDIFIGWPVVILIVVLLFRKQIEQFFGVLGERLRRISVAGATAEFETAQRGYRPELQEANRGFIPQNVQAQGEEDLGEDEIDQDLTSRAVYGDDVPITEDTDEDDKTVSDTEEEVVALKRRLDEMKKR